MMAGCENSETTQFISSFPNLDENLSQIHTSRTLLFLVPSTVDQQTVTKSVDINQQVIQFVDSNCTDQ